jgi:hypothetical protein
VTRRPSLTTLVAVLLVVASACSSSGSSSQRPTSTTAKPSTSTAVDTPTSGATGGVPKPFTGSVADFYDPPNPLPKGKPGELIRVQDVSDTGGIVTKRIMYHSIDAAGRDQPTTGTISYPTAKAPSGGWPVVSIAPGTVGLDTHCALSRNDNPVDGFGITGVAVRTDYIGMVKGQRMRYLSGPSEAHSVIDATRAARNIPAAHAGRRWVAFGHSQGGHSALFTNQLAKGYAPELQLLGTVVGAPAAELTKQFGPADVVIPHMVELMALYGIAGDHPDIDPDHYVAPEVVKSKSVLETGCLGEITGAFAKFAASGMFPIDPVTTPPAAAIVKANDPGQVKAPTPIMLFEGTKDVFVVPARVASLYQRLCKLGQVTDYLELPGADHGTEQIQGRRQISTWIADRFAAKPAPDTCPSTR